MIPPRISIRLSLVSTWVLVSVIVPSLWGCKQSTAPSEESPAGVARDTTRVDTVRSAPDWSEADSPPSPEDRAALRQWADSLRTKGQSRQSEAPVQARDDLGKALHGYRLLADSTMVGRTIDDVGFTYRYQSQYKEAITQFKKALAIHRRLDERKRIANLLHDIGIIRDDQGQHEQALARFREALEIKREIGDQVTIPRSLNSIGIIRWRQGQYEEALDRFQESLEIYREQEDRAAIAAILNNIGVIHRDQGQLKQALARFQEALELKRDLGDQRGIARTLNNVGNVYEKRGNGEKALPQYQAALRIERKIGDRKRIAEYLNDIGGAHLRAGRLQTATDTLQRAVDLAESLRVNATSPEARRSLLSTQISAYRALTTANVRAGRPDSALHSLERVRARLLTDRLAGTARSDTAFSIPAARRLRQTLGPKEVALLYANAGSTYPLTTLAVTRDTTVARELPDATIRDTVGHSYASELRRLRQQEGPLAAALGPDRIDSQDGRPSLAEVIRLYRYYLVRDEAEPSIQQDLAQQLYGLLVAPVEERLQPNETLTVVPTGALGYFPFEALMTASGQYLVERTRVRYAQSLTVLRQLQDRDYSNQRQPLLAFGGAVYGSDHHPPDTALIVEARSHSKEVRTEAQASSLLRSAQRRMEQGKSPRRTYTRLGYSRWRPLPGTKLEVNKLKRAIGNGTTILAGSDATEERVRQMSNSGQLARYRWIHFATHGVAVPEAPTLSALVLSQSNASDSLAARDGYLTMEEIAGLKMNADVAVLSACQTGLGRIIAGEGVVSLSHAFLRAGANATLVSQWRVPDWSTQQFMTATYRNAKAEDVSVAEATAQVKRAFIAGRFGERNTDPLRWAPFVYYGRE